MDEDGAQARYAGPRFLEVLIQLQMTPAAARGWDGQAFYPD
jgi:hypothetical protein